MPQKRQTPIVPIFHLEPSPALTAPKRLSAYDKMAQFGRWGEAGWWQPFKNAQSEPKKRIEQEGFVVTRIA